MMKTRLASFFTVSVMCSLTLAIACTSGGGGGGGGGNVIHFDNGVHKTIDLGNDNPDDPDMTVTTTNGKDMATTNTSKDFSTGKPDLTTINTGGNGACAQEVQCAFACTSSSCLDGCSTTAGMTADNLFGAAVGCAQDFCVNTQSECTVDSMNQLQDPTGSPSGTCTNCLNDALAALGGYDCSSSSSPDCNPSSCTSSVNACLNN